MKANDFYLLCRDSGTWVDWDDTTDVFLYGDPDTPVRGVAVTWLATNAVLQKAADRGLNFVVAHEGAFYPNFQSFESEKQHHQAKRELMAELGIVLFRCHDVWDRMPEYGVRDSWADFLGFATRPCDDVNSFYRISDVDNLTVAQIAQRISRKTSEWGQTTVRVIAPNPQKKIRRLVTGTGAITNLAEMYEQGADLIVATDDGFHTTYCGLWSLDLEVPLILVDHPTSELPGMVNLAKYMKKKYPAIKVEYLPCDFPAQEISGSIQDAATVG